MCNMPRVMRGCSKRPRKSVFHTLHMMANRIQSSKFARRRIGRNRRKKCIGIRTSVFTVFICGGELALTWHTHTHTQIRLLCCLPLLEAHHFFLLLLLIRRRANFEVFTSAAQHVCHITYAHVNESCHARKRVMRRIWISRLAHSTWPVYLGISTHLYTRLLTQTHANTNARSHTHRPVFMRTLAIDATGPDRK